MSYGPRIDAIVYGVHATNDYTREDWIRIALAALDQAGVHPRMLAEAYRHGGNKVNAVLAELDEDGPYLTKEEVSC